MTSTRSELPLKTFAAIPVRTPCDWRQRSSAWVSIGTATRHWPSMLSTFQGMCMATCSMSVPQHCPRLVVCRQHWPSINFCNTVVELNRASYTLQQGTPGGLQLLGSLLQLPWSVQPTSCTFRVV